MPTYSYRCRSCDHKFEKYQMMDDRKIPESEPCPNCEYYDVYQSVSTPRLLYTVDNSLKTTSSFNDRMKEIKKGKGKDNTIETRGVS